MAGEGFQGLQGEQYRQAQGRNGGEKADQYSALIDEMGSLPLGDPKVEELFLEASKIFFDELPVIPITQAKKIIPFDTTYWSGWPTFPQVFVKGTLIGGFTELQGKLEDGSLKSELGWKPSESFESGIARTIDWYLANQDWCEHIRDGSYRGERLGLVAST